MSELLEKPTFQELKEDVLRRRASALFDQLVDLTQNEGGKEELVFQLGRLYESAEFDAWEISSHLTNNIGDIVAPRTIRKVCAKHGWTNPTYGGGTNAAPDSSLSLNTLTETDPFYQLKLPYYKAFCDIRDTINTCIEVLCRQYEVETLENGGRVKKPLDWKPLFESVEDRKEYYKAVADMFYNIKATADKCMDGRQSALPLMLFGFIAKISSATIKHFSSKWFAKIRTDLVDITTKQCTKFIRAEDTKSALLSSYMADAWQWNTLDLKCPTCKRSGINHYVKPVMSSDGTWDFVCDNWKVHGKDLLHFSHELLTIRLNSLEMDRGRASQFYLAERGIEAMPQVEK